MKKTYYVWQDNFLEELFAMEKNELDTEYVGLKNQLEKEKVVFIEVLADSTTEAFEAYHLREKNLRIQAGIDKEEDALPGSQPSEIIKKKTLH